jgi:hypothetical protein
MATIAATHHATSVHRTITFQLLYPKTYCLQTRSHDVLSEAEVGRRVTVMLGTWMATTAAACTRNEGP